MAPLLGLLYLVTERLYLLTTFLQFSLPSPPASGNHKSDLFFFEFTHMFVLEVSDPPTYSAMLVPVSQHSDLFLYISK